MFKLENGQLLGAVIWHETAVELPKESNEYVVMHHTIEDIMHPCVLRFSVKHGAFNASDDLPTAPYAMDIDSFPYWAEIDLPKEIPAKKGEKG